jgi:hypothetical protein
MRFSELRNSFLRASIIVCIFNFVSRGTGKKADAVRGAGRRKRHIESGVWTGEKLRSERESRQSVGGIMILRRDGRLDGRVVEIGFQMLN